MKRRNPIALVALALVATIGLAALLAVIDVYDAPFVGTKYQKAIGRYEGPSPFELGPVDGRRGPIITADDVTDVEARYVTDPFVVREGPDWFMFLGVRKADDNLGAIGLATSTDGEDWRYRGLVLEETFHTSFPHVFIADGEYHLIPESAGSGAVRLYRADEFPTSWVLESVLVEGDYTDATPFEHDGRWWMFLGANPRSNDRLELYMADDVRGPWLEHPASPIVEGDANIARPGGPVLSLDGHLFRVAQDDDPTYGNGLWAFEILELTSTSYVERPVDPEQLLGTSDADWNNIGLGHLDAIQTGPDEWVAFLSGEGESWGVGFDR